LNHAGSRTFSQFLAAARRSAKRHRVRIMLASPSQCPWCGKDFSDDIDAARLVVAAGTKTT